MLKGHIFFLCTIFFVTVLLTAAAFGQTTIFNIPTADTLQHGSWSLEGDFVGKPTSYRDGGFQTYGYRVAYGLNNKTELGTNFYYTWNGSTSAGQAEFSLKEKIYRNERLGVSVSGGTVAFVPLRSTSGDKTHAIVYANASKEIAQLNGLTLTGGVYHIFGGGRNFGTRTGAMVGLVQPLNQRFSFVADWFTGQNRLGYASAAINYNVTKRQYLMTGYSFGNSGCGNNAFAAYYGFTF